MATDTALTIMRVSKENGTTMLVTEQHALDRLSNAYYDPAEALRAATEDSPAQTPFALYWRVA